MPTFEPLIPGIYARSETLVRTTRDHDRDRVGDEKLREDQARDTENLIGVQAKAGFTTVSPGLLTWQDPFRPFDPLIDALEPETLTRFIDTNTFYRRPDVEGPVELETSQLSTFAEEHVPTTGPLDGLATLPAPTAWVAAARDEDGEYPDASLATELAETVYPPVLETLADRGVTTLALADPWLARYPDPTELLGSVDALLAEQATDLEVHLQPSFQDASPFLEEIARLDLDGVLVDATETPLDALTALDGELTVGLGLVDARTSLVERPDLVVSSIGEAVDRLATDRFAITPTGDLQHVPETIARRKTRGLGQAAETAARKFGGETR